MCEGGLDTPVITPWSQLQPQLHPGHQLPTTTFTLDPNFNHNYTLAPNLRLHYTPASLNYPLAPNLHHSHKYSIPVSKCVCVLGGGGD